MEGGQDGQMKSESRMCEGAKKRGQKKSPNLNWHVGFPNPFGFISPIRPVKSPDGEFGHGEERPGV